jgi:hypothetical protein
MTPACPSNRVIARWEAGRLLDGDERRWLEGHTRSCARCSSVVAEIAAARGDLFAADSGVEAARAAHTMMTIAAARAVPRRRWRGWGGWAGAPLLVGAAAVLLLVPALKPRQPSVMPPPGVRAKGQLAVEAFCKRADKVFPVGDGGAYYRGDRLRFAYSTPADGHLMVLGVDDRGQIFPYYGEGRLSSVPAAAGAKVMLPGSVELDDHNGAERVFVLWAAAPIDGGAVKRAVAEALAAGADITRAARLPLELDQVSFLLRRP